MSPRAARPGTALLAAILAALLAGCASAPAPSAPAPSLAPGASATAAPATPAGPPATAVPEGALVLDDALLAVLPADVAGVPVAAEPLAWEDVRDDADLAAAADRIAFFVAAGPDDLASGSVVRLRPGVFDAAFWRSWRDTYDEGACAQADGVAGRAETELAGRPVYITTCNGGLRTYHAHLEAAGVLVSLFSAGEGRFGERLVLGLRDGTP